VQTIFVRRPLEAFGRSIILVFPLVPVLPACAQHPAIRPDQGVLFLPRFLSRGVIRQALFIK